MFSDIYRDIGVATRAENSSCKQTNRRKRFSKKNNRNSVVPLIEFLRRPNSF